MALNDFGFAALSITFFIVLGIIGFALIFWAIWLYRRNKRYKEYKVVIWEQDGNNDFDSAGIFVDRKTNNKRFFLKKHNVGLNPDNVPYRREGKDKVVYLVRHGLKNFSFVDINKTVDELIDKRRLNFIVGEEDVNWSINAYERQKKIFNLDKFMQYLPFIIFGFVTICIVIMIIYVLKQFTVLRDVAVELKMVAETLKQIKLGTVVVS